MKPTRAYTMDQDVIQILKRQPNKSQHVNKCVRSYNKNKAAFDRHSIETKKLIELLLQKQDIGLSFRAILNEEWSKL